MGSPDWSKIPFEKMPQWKKDELLKSSKAVVEKLEAVDTIKVTNLTCEVCGKEFTSERGLKIHKSKHKA